MLIIVNNKVIQNSYHPKFVNPFCNTLLVLLRALLFTICMIINCYIVLCGVFNLLRHLIEILSFTASEMTTELKQNGIQYQTPAGVILYSLLRMEILCLSICISTPTCEGISIVFHGCCPLCIF